MESQTAIQGDLLERLRQANEAELHTYLTEMIGSAEIAQELVKDSFARIRISRPEQAAFPRAVLFRVGTNLALLHLRQRRAEQVGLAPAMESEEVRDARSDRVRQNRQRSADEYGASLAIAIKALHLPHRKVFVMTYVQRMLRKDIASELGISEARVDRHMTKALKAIRDRLAARGIDPADMFGLFAVLPLACLLTVH